MRYLFRFIFVISFVSIGLVFLERSAIMQENRDKINLGANVENCVKVTLIADSDKYQLKKGNSISVVVRIENLSDERLKLRHKPVFNFRRVGVKEGEIKLGDSYTGRIASKKSSNSGNLFIERHKYRDFVVVINELELHDKMSSINVWANIFRELEKGEYYFETKAVVDSSNEEKEAFNEFTSNKVLVAIP